VPKLDVDGVGLAYDDVGRRDGVPLVFIHGWTANRHRWDDQLGHFAGRYRVVSLDLRGHSDPMGPCHRCRPPTSLSLRHSEVAHGQPADRFLLCHLGCRILSAHPQPPLASRSWGTDRASRGRSDTSRPSSEVAAAYDSPLLRKG
jgi:pimeloyl-ACP methyl ester carboxylesterase